MAWPSGMAKWHGQMAWPNGMAKWHGQMAWPNGMAKWHGQMAWPNGMAKRNVRRKCAAFTLISGTLHCHHKKHGDVRVIQQSEKNQILHACHSVPTSGHFGVNKTTQKSVSRYFWPSLYKDVEDFIGKSRIPKYIQNFIYKKHSNDNTHISICII